MRVCFFVPSLGDGGAQRQCVALLNQLQHRPNMEIHLILLGPGQYERDLNTSGVAVHRTRVSNFSSPAALKFLVGTLRRVRPDLLMSWLHPADIWAYPATRIVRNVRWILTERGSYYPDELVYNTRIRFGRLGADLVIANSPAGERLWTGFRSGPPVRMIPNMTLGTPIITSGADRSAGTDCLYVGRFAWQKNVTAIAAAFALFATTRPGPRLLMAGQGEQQNSVMQIASDGGIASRVELLGYRRDVPALMAQARLLLSFSRFEGMPNVIMEAVAAELPVVVSDIPEHRMLLGPDYPYYVSLDAPPGTGADVIARAWTEGPGRVAHLYAHARAVLAASAPRKVAAAYVDAFESVRARASNRTLRGAESGL